MACALQKLTNLLRDSAPGCCQEQPFESYSGRRSAVEASKQIRHFIVRRA